MIATTRQIRMVQGHLQRWEPGIEGLAIGAGAGVADRAVRREFPVISSAKPAALTIGSSGVRRSLFREEPVLQ
jgi:hypothetical protein